MIPLPLTVDSDPLLIRPFEWATILFVPWHLPMTTDP
jgi:hypothetical protein